MLEYLNLCLLCTLFALICYMYIRAKRYLPLFKMAEEIFSSNDAQSDTKRQKLLECVLTWNSKLYLEEVEKLFNNYKAKLSGQMVKSLGKLIINIYLMGACAVLGISNQDALSEDLESDPFLNSALQGFTCELYYRFSSLLAPLNIGIITSRHYLYECNKNGETSGDNEGPQPTSTLGPKRELLSSTGLFIGTELLGFWFGVGATLGAKMVNSLEELMSR